MVVMVVVVVHGCTSCTVVEVVYGCTSVCSCLCLCIHGHSSCIHCSSCIKKLSGFPRYVRTDHSAWYTSIPKAIVSSEKCTYVPPINNCGRVHKDIEIYVYVLHISTVVLVLWLYAYMYHNYNDCAYAVYHF